MLFSHCNWFIVKLQLFAMYSKHKLFRLRGVFALLTIYLHSNCYGYVPMWVQQKDIANNRCAAVETLSMSLKLSSMNKTRMTFRAESGSSGGNKQFSFAFAAVSLSDLSANISFQCGSGWCRCVCSYHPPTARTQTFQSKLNIKNWWNENKRNAEWHSATLQRYQKRNDSSY